MVNDATQKLGKHISKILENGEVEIPKGYTQNLLSTGTGAAAKFSYVPIAYPQSELCVFEIHKVIKVDVHINPVFSC